jgi:hypothetical protein
LLNYWRDALYIFFRFTSTKQLEKGTYHTLLSYKCLKV